MNDPWNVKAIRAPGQYVSCMKINGVPLLPPVLSKECHKEMQYYKLLAKEVEKRISILRPLVSSDSTEESTVPELSHHERYELPQDDVEAGFDVNIDKITAIGKDNAFDRSFSSDNDPMMVDMINNITSNVVVKTTDTIVHSPKLVIDLSLSINETGKNLLESIHKTPQRKTPSPIELPERDYEYDEPQKDVIFDVETVHINPNNNKKIKERTKDVINFSFNLERENISEEYDENFIRSDGPSSISCKSFTGSLNDLHSESTKDMTEPKLTRQSSYTVLKPSPQLLAHLEVESMTTGIAMSAISMSDSLSNIHSPSRKRKSWDLETAKVKWSSMALELKHATTKTKTNANLSYNNNTEQKKTTKVYPRSRSVALDNSRRNSAGKYTPKSDPVHKSRNVVSPVKHSNSKTLASYNASPKHAAHKREAITTKKKIPSPPNSCDAEDPGSRVRELYEKIQKQQITQMASLMEKQKKEQMLLQKVFEEQNNMLFKQLKMICPTTLTEVREAWGENEDRGPVSLSQLINLKSPKSETDNPVTILNDSQAYLTQCDSTLKKSKDITNSINRDYKCKGVNGSKTQTLLTNVDGRRPSPNSPAHRNSSRKLNYESPSTDFDPPLTDRTNDTMADLNTTFPSDVDDVHTFSSRSITAQPKGVRRQSPTRQPQRQPIQSTDSAIRSLECSIQNSMNTMPAYGSNASNRYARNSAGPRVATTKEKAAATTIVAHAKGYLVRRLMRTERVQTTVQTIKDALLCALELHMDREGIKGTDVDLHRRLIQQITAACYNLHDTFVASSPAERCAAIAADRLRRRAQASRTPPARLRHTDVMSLSHSGAFPARLKRAPAAAMTQSSYETYSKCVPRYLPSPRRRASRPWR